MANLAIFFGWMAELAELQFGLAELTILPMKYSAKTQLNVVGPQFSHNSSIEFSQIKIFTNPLVRLLGR